MLPFSILVIIMAKLSRNEKNRSLESFLDMDNPSKNGVPLQPRNTIPGHGLEFKNLSYSIIKEQKKDGVRIKKEVYLLDDISGQAMRGEVMAIMGPSGAGKSTFLDALAGRIAQGSLEGSVRIDGKPVSKILITFINNVVKFFMLISLNLFVDKIVQNVDNNFFFYRLLQAT